MSVRIVINKNRRSGQPHVTVEGVGIVGPGCEQITQRLRDALGTTTANEHKQEYFESELLGESEIQMEGQ